MRTSDFLSCFSKYGEQLRAKINLKQTLFFHLLHKLQQNQTLLLASIPVIYDNYLLYHRKYFLDNFSLLLWEQTLTIRVLVYVTSSIEDKQQTKPFKMYQISIISKNPKQRRNQAQTKELKNQSVQDEQMR